MRFHDATCYCGAPNPGKRCNWVACDREPGSPQREDASGEEAPPVSLSTKAVRSADLPHLDRACELLWQAGQPRVAEALAREARELIEERDRLARILDPAWRGGVSPSGKERP